MTLAAVSAAYYYYYYYFFVFETICNTKWEMYFL